MPLDLHEALEEAAASPTERFELEPLWRRGRRRKWSKRAVATLGAGAVAVFVLVVVSSTLPLDRADEAPPADGTWPQTEVTHIQGLPASVESVAVAPDGEIWVQGFGVLSRIDPNDNEVDLEVQGEESAMKLAVGSDSLWLSGWRGDTGPGRGTPPRGFVQRIDTSTIPPGAVTVGAGDLSSNKLESGKNEAPESITLGEGAAWVTERLSDVLWKLDLDDGELVTKVAVDAAPVDVAAGFGSIWVIHTGTDRHSHGEGGASLLEVDPDANEAVGNPVDAGECPHSVEVGEDAVWVLDSCERALRRFDPSTHELEGIAHLEHSVGSIALSEGLVWVAGWDEAVVTRVDAATLEVEPRPIQVGGGQIWSLAFGSDAAWVGTTRGLKRIDVSP